jgi:hypothetical protein
MDGSGEPCCKFRRTLGKYGIPAFEQEIEDQWIATDGPGLRCLADQFNKRILREALEGTGGPPLDGEVDNLYGLLTDEDTSAGVYTEAKNRLRERGVDPELVEGDFISYQTVNRHFKNCKELSKEERKIGPDDLKDRVFALQSRTSAVTGNTVSQLQRRDRLRITEPDIFVEITVGCEQCGTVVPIAEAMDGEECACFE